MTTNTDLRFHLVDYNNIDDTNTLVQALDTYARDPMGGGKCLSDFARKNLPSALAELPHAFSILMFHGNEVAGLANCFEGFSTFACRKLVNIHDFVVLPHFRGLQLSQHLLQAVEAEAKRRNCCKLTLEVLEGNMVARKAYQKFGFISYELDASTGKALFLQKEFH